MAKKTFVVGSFDDENVLFPAVQKVRTAGYKIKDVYTPFAVHGLDHALGMRETKLHIAGFIYGIIGMLTALLGISWILVFDWPLIFDGKPHFALPAWIPITFELTVLFASVGMVLTFCYISQLMPFVKKHHFNLRATDDLFVLVIETTSQTNIDDCKAFLLNAGAIDANVQFAEEGWWLGRYDKDTMRFEKNKIVAA
jgi:hypothetical protein